MGNKLRLEVFLAMKLNNQERAMLAGDFGLAVKWAMEHQLQVGRMFDAEDMVDVSQAHMMADPESLGEAGVAFAEKLAETDVKVRVPMITDPRGVDLNYYEPLGQTENMAVLERRFIAACKKMGITMTNTCINYQTIMPPVFGDHVAFGDTGVVIYSNSVCGARSNFEGGPSALAAGLTGRTPRYGLHLDDNRRATKRYQVAEEPQDLMDWGALGATIGRMAGSYWEVPVIEGIETGLGYQTLLGVTGSGKTFTIAKVIEKMQRPTLVMAPNKTLAAQLYGEFKEFFPKNAIEYFVSYYDYYQPEAYVPASDTYIEKDASINEHIEQMRLSATKALLERDDTIVVASVSAIYGLGDPVAYLKMVLHLDRGDTIDQRQILRRLTEMQYTRNDIELRRSTYRVRGDVIDIFPAESDKEAIRVELFDEEIEELSYFDPLTGEVNRKVPRITMTQSK